VDDGEVAVARAPACWKGDLLRAADVLAGDRLGAGYHVLQAAGDHDAAPLLAGAGAEVDDVVGGADGGLVVLHHQDRVAEVAQALEGVDQAGAVDGVQADGGLVADVEDAHQAGADLGGQAQALGLAGGEGGRGPIDGEVIDAHVHQEAQARADLLENLMGDGLLTLAEDGLRPLELLYPGQGLHHAHPGDDVDVPIADGDRQRFGLEARALADRTGVGRHVALDLHAHVVGFRLAVAALQVGDDPLEGGVVVLRAAELVHVLDGHHLVAAVQ